MKAIEILKGKLEKRIKELKRDRSHYERYSATYHNLTVSIEWYKTILKDFILNSIKEAGDAEKDAPQ